MFSAEFTTALLAEVVLDHALLSEAGACGSARFARAVNKSEPWLIADPTEFMQCLFRGIATRVLTGSAQSAQPALRFATVLAQHGTVNVKLLERALAFHFPCIWGSGVLHRDAARSGAMEPPPGAMDGESA